MEKKDHEKSIKTIQAHNQKNKLVHRFDRKIANKKWPLILGYKNINVCSSAAGVWIVI